MKFSRLVPLVLVALAAGAIAARAESTNPAPPRAKLVHRIEVMRRVLYACTPAKPADKGAPPSQALLNAFAVLRRPATPDDALAPEALKALQAMGLAPVSPDSARLLRTTASGGKAWVVPVPNVGLSRACPAAVRLPMSKAVPASKAKPQEGLAVVATGDAAEGGGGALDDLVRGRAPVSVDPCAGQDRSMVGVSGIVPDGVASVYLTAADGTAVKADVKENGYEFLVARAQTLQPRYVVWTGGDGTPHVQPVVGWQLRTSSCRRSVPATKVPRVTPTAMGACVAHQPTVIDVVRARRARESIYKLAPLPFPCDAEWNVTYAAPAAVPVPVPAHPPTVPLPATGPAPAPPHNVPAPGPARSHPPKAATPAAPKNHG